MGYLDAARGHSKAAKKHFKSGKLTKQKARDCAAEHTSAAGCYALSEGENMRAGLPRNDKSYGKIFEHLSWVKSMKSWLSK